MKENRRTNDGIRKASPTEVSWWISIHGPAHLGLWRPTGRQCWVCACAICGYNRSTLCLLAKKQEFRKKCLDRTLPVFQHLRGSGMATENRKKSHLGHHGSRSWAPGVLHPADQGPYSCGPTTAVPWPSSQIEEPPPPECTAGIREAIFFFLLWPRQDPPYAVIARVACNSTGHYGTLAVSLWESHKKAITLTPKPNRNP